MIYVLGGASRSGKTLLARRAVLEKGIPYFPLDALFGGLANGAPEFGVRYDNSLKERPLKMWPISKHLFNFFFEEEKDFLIEGDSILPSQVNEMLVDGKSVKACFVGYTEMSKENKLSLVRKHNQGEIDWTKGISDEEMTNMIDEMIEFSTYIKDQCDKYGFKYFDISNNFESAHEEVFKYLFSE